MEGYKDNSGFNAVFGSGGGGSAPTINRDFGGFYSTQIQSVTAPNTEIQIAIEQTNFSNGVSCASDGTISFTHEGMYMIELTLQFTHQAPITNDYVYVWFKQNGANQYMTTREMILNSTIRSGVMSLSYMVAIYPFPYALPTISLFWSATSSDIILDTIFTPIGKPQSDTPSVICNVFQIA
jgi:hypothetical protein